jgi:hypothetical protein
VCNLVSARRSQAARMHSPDTAEPHSDGTAAAAPTVTETSVRMGHQAGISAAVPAAQHTDTAAAAAVQGGNTTYVVSRKTGHHTIVLPGAWGVAGWASGLRGPQNPSMACTYLARGSQRAVHKLTCDVKWLAPALPRTQPEDDDILNPALSFFKLLSRSRVQMEHIAALLTDTTSVQPCWWGSAAP